MTLKRAWLIAFTAVLIAVGVIKGPAAFAAGGLSGVTFSGSPQTGGATATWTVGFTTSSGQAGALGAGDTITVTFNSAFGVNGVAVSPGSGLAGCTATASTAGATITITLAGSTCTHLKGTGATLNLAGVTNAAQAASYPASSFSVATVQDGSASPAGPVVIGVGAAAKLAFTTAPPTTGTAGSPLATFKVSVQDAGGNTVSTATDPVTLTVASGPSGGTFSSAPATYTNVAASAGVATFTGVALNLAGTYTLTAARSGLTPATSGAVVISAATGSKLAFVQGPSGGFAGTALAPAITVQVQDQNGNAVSAAGVVVTLTPSAGQIDSGASATTNSSGRATFSGVVINTAALGLTLTASASGLTSTAASASFNVTVAVAGGAALTDTTSDGSGSGVKAVAYYYCTGYSGTCSSSTWTLIGSSTDAATGYQVTWTSTPTPGAYRIVATSTDNVTNLSQSTTATPVTVTS
ncbi:hypothetical protein ACFV9C_16650 [Kribbella sp. NPDC059898]|uniref:hypothetical protein n=1 Tax=Kribbella sp. NPDC059898 TaxID=3346995 RepID=UPI003662F55F